MQNLMDVKSKADSTYLPTFKFQSTHLTPAIYSSSLFPFIFADFFFLPFLSSDSTNSLGTLLGVGILRGVEGLGKGLGMPLPSSELLFLRFTDLSSFEPLEELASESSEPPLL
jgi:hypothetical protein